MGNATEGECDTVCSSTTSEAELEAAADSFHNQENEVRSNFRQVIDWLNLKVGDKAADRSIEEGSCGVRSPNGFCNLQ